MMRRAMVGTFCLWTTLAGLNAQPGPPEPTPSLGDFLVKALRFTPDQVAAVRRGEAVAVNWPSSVDREVAVAGAIHIDAPAERLVRAVQDIESLERGGGFLATKKLSEPPRLDDFATFRVPTEDLEALRTCRPGKCDVKLGQGAFDRLAGIDWAAPDVTDRVNELARRTAVEYVQAYQKGGNQELAIYLDSGRPSFIAQEFADMVRRTTVLTGSLPDLSAYVLSYPNARPPGVEEFFYWSLADFGLKPVFRLNHVVIQPTNRTTGVVYAMATKQLYATHYFHTALEVRAVIDDAAKPGRAHYLLTLNMARSDGLTGMFGGLVKSKARSGSRDGLRRALLAMKRRCETP